MPWPRVRWLAAVAAAFVASRLIYHMVGLRFDVSPITWFWQYVDPDLLRLHLSQSLLYLHSQPPLANLGLGLVLNAFPGHESAVFAALFHFAGFVLATTLFLFMAELGISDRLSALATFIFVASPACILYESWLFYTMPVAAMLAVMARHLHRFFKHGSALDLLLCFSLAAFTALTWSLFHVAWFVLLAALLVAFRRNDWRRIALSALVPLMLIVGWYAKNQSLFGRFTNSTWFGMNLSKMTNSMLSVSERRVLVSTGKVSQVSLVPPFSSLERYQTLIPPTPPTGVPVLDEEVKPSGVPNYNNLSYIAVSRQYGRDALRILLIKPDAYLRASAEAWQIWFTPASAYYFLSGNRQHFSRLERFWSFLEGRILYHRDRTLKATAPARYYVEGLLNTGILIILAYLLVVIYGVVLIVRRRDLDPARLTILFLTLNVVYVMLVGNAIEVGENNRFRFSVDPLVLVIVIYVVQQALARRPARA
jgi:hypothetical protein